VRSLFARILVWFLAAIAVTAIAFVVTSALTISETRERHFPLALLVRIETRVARAAYESGGRAGLAAALQRFSDDTAMRGFLVDSTGRDLLSGEDRSEIVHTPLRVSGRAALRGENTFLSHTTEDGHYAFVLEVPRRRFFLTFLNPHYLGVLGLVVLLCYALARSLTAPLRRLQKAVDEFGQGNLSARVRSKRADELGELSRNFDRMADRIASLMTAERRLLGDVSHELRSPLARLSVAVELARSGDDLDAPLNRIQREADRLNALVGELLQVNRAEMDPRSRKQDDIRVDELVGGIVEDSRIEADARNVSLVFENPPEATLQGDGELLRRAVENIVRNAIRYAPAGTQIDVTLDVNPGRVKIAVRDRGPGVPEEALTHLFDAFYRVDSDRNRSSGGVGLGLSIARRAVELHNGVLRAKNADPGLRVEIELLR
jgi:signal transduction histidine kinase